MDTHVHRLANQLGMVNTKTPEQTERALMELLPKNKWSDVNYLFVTFAQQVPRRKQVELIEELLNKKKCTA